MISLICGPAKIPAFSICMRRTGNFLHMQSKQLPSLFIHLTNCFIKSSLMCNGGKMILSLSTMILQLHSFLLPPSFISEAIVFSPNAHPSIYFCRDSIMQRYLVYSLCWPWRKFTTFSGEVFVALWLTCWTASSEEASSNSSCAISLTFG